MLVFTVRTRQLIQLVFQNKNMQTGDLMRLAKSEGFLTLQDIGRQFIARHIISLEEFQRTLVMDT